MFMNRKSDYALRIIRALADGKRHTANSLATNEQIPLAFAYKILKNYPMQDWSASIAAPAEAVH